MCTLIDEGEGTSCQLFEIEGEGASVLINVGYDTERDVSYSLQVALGLVPGSPASDRELIFYIAEHDAEAGRDHWFWDGRETKFIPAVDRLRILGHLLSALGHLIKIVEPERVLICAVRQLANCRHSHMAKRA